MSQEIFRAVLKQGQTLQSMVQVTSMLSSTFHWPIPGALTGLNNAVAALKRENKKIENYNGERYYYIGSELVPLVCEHFGYWGKDSVRFLNWISLRSRDDDGKILTRYLLEACVVGHFTEMQRN